MTGTISTTLTASYTLSVNPTTILSTGAVLIGPQIAAYAVIGSAGSAWTLINAGRVINGPGGGGINLRDGGSLTNAAGAVISAAGSNGIDIGGAVGTVFNAGSIYGALAGIDLLGGTVTNAAGGAINAHFGRAAGIEGGSGAVTVTNAGTIDALGGSASGISLQGGGTIVNQSGGVIGATGGSAVGIVLDAAGSVINQSGGTILGYGGAAVGISLAAGGSVINQSGGTILGYGGGAVGIGLGAEGSVTNQSGGLISATGNGIVLQGGGTVVNQAGATVIANAFDAAGVSVVGGAGTVVNSGTISAGPFAAVSLAAGFANRVVADTGAVFTGTVNGGGVLSTLELGTGAASGTITSLGSQFVNFGTVQFDQGTAWFAEGSAAGLSGQITGFARGDTIEIDGLTATGSAFVGGVLTLTGYGVVSSATLDMAGTDLSGFEVVDVAGGTEITPCFAAGTRIATTRGAIAVECLREGDEVLTVSGGRQPIAWIGYRRVDCLRHPAQDRVWPIQVAPHAFGEGRPARTLLLSPDHAVFMEGVLIPIRFLCNDTTVKQIEVDTVTYYHVELPHHDVLLAEGLPAESYLETGARSAFANSGLPMQMHPDFAPDPARVAMVWQNFGYAPLLGDAATVERVRVRLRLQAMLLDAAAVRPCLRQQPSRQA